jgi:DNA-directed RNA polymerase specialized sigma24 family protein
MTSLANTIQPVLPALRRYACAATGDRRTGDWYVRVALETLLQEPSRVSADGDVKFQLFRLLSEALMIGGPLSFDVAGEATDEPPHSLKQRIASLPILTRQVFLLVVLEGFTVKEAAALQQISRQEAELHLQWARFQCRSPENPVTARLAKVRPDQKRVRGADQADARIAAHAA